MKAKPKKDSTETKKPAQTNQVEALAYAIFAERKRTGAPGDHLSDWYEAERQVTAPRL